MTIRISLRVAAFVVYTLALLGGAFGISYAVFEWRDDEPTGVDLTAIEQKIDALEQQIDAGPTQAELDAQRCEAALEALGNAVPAAGRTIGDFTIGGGVPLELRDAVDRYCK